MLDVRRITGSTLCAVIVAATVICICAPDAVQAAPAEHNCCHKTSKSTEFPPGQNCPSCSWSILRSGDVHAQHIVINPPIEAHVFATIDVPQVSNFPALEPQRCESPPRPPTLLDLHCQLLA